MTCHKKRLPLWDFSCLRGARNPIKTSFCFFTQLQLSRYSSACCIYTSPNRHCADCCLPQAYTKNIWLSLSLSYIYLYISIYKYEREIIILRGPTCSREAISSFSSLYLLSTFTREKQKPCKQLESEDDRLLWSIRSNNGKLFSLFLPLFT